MEIPAPAQDPQEHKVKAREAAVAAAKAKMPGPISKFIAGRIAQRKFK